MDTPTGPRLTDEAPGVTGPERDILVSAMVERWHRVRTPNAPPDVVLDEALGFLEQLIAAPTGPTGPAV